MKLPVVKYWSRSSGCATASRHVRTSSGSRGSRDAPGDAVADTARARRRRRAARCRARPRDRAWPGSGARSISEQRCACMSSPTSASRPSTSCRGSCAAASSDEHAVDQVERARRLPQRLAAAVQLDVRLLELRDRGRELLLDQLRAALGAAHRLRCCVASRSRRERARRRRDRGHACGRRLARVARAAARASASRRTYSPCTRCVTSSSVRTASSRASRSAEPARTRARTAPRPARSARARARRRSCAARRARAPRAGSRRSARRAATSVPPSGSGDAEQARDLGRAVAQVDEPAAGHDAESDLRGQVIEARLERLARRLRHAGRDALPQQCASLVVRAAARSSRRGRAPQAPRRARRARASTSGATPSAWASEASVRGGMSAGE